MSVGPFVRPTTPCIKLQGGSIKPPSPPRRLFIRAFIFHMLIGLGEDKNTIDFGFTRSKVKVIKVTFVKKFSTQYLENYLSYSFHISHAD